jgi:alanine-glyoxylate transaminase / serine-glyoxylate transaminase / serine-pyruvate transaminase
MSLSNGRSYLAIPGPSVIPDQVLQAMHRPSPNIYEGELIEITESLIPDLKYVGQTDGYVAIYIANGHGAWEAALANMAEAGDTILVAATGSFAHGWAEIAENMGIKTQIIEFGTHSPIDADFIEEALRADVHKKIKAVLVTHVDTSSSVRNDVQSVRLALDACHHPALLAADCVASLACDTFEMDNWGVDIMVAGSQKGLMVPPGISFVYFNERAKIVQTSLSRVSSYWNWAPRIAPQRYYEYFCGTAPTQHIYGLRVALDMIRNEGLEAIFARHEILARAIWSAVECWGTGDGKMRLNIQNEYYRSRAVTALSIGAPFGLNLRHWVEKKAGLTLGIGLGMSSPEDPNGDGFFRFGHMGHVNAQMIMGLIGTVEAGLCALDIPHGPGACDAAAKQIALAT